MPYRPETRRTMQPRNSENHKRQYDAVRRRIFDLLGNRCIVCGFDNPTTLQIDHVNGGGTKERQLYRTRGLRTYYRDILKKIEIGDASYQLLCANCNCIKKDRSGEEKR
jgi:hypothetical protein